MYLETRDNVLLKYLCLSLRQCLIWNQLVCVSVGKSCFVNGTKGDNLVFTQLTYLVGASNIDTEAESYW